MASFNRVVLVGNLTRDIEIKYTPGGTAVANPSLAVNRKWFDKQTNTNKDEVAFVDCTLWGRTAEVAAEYLRKGSQVLFEGRLAQETWKDKATGQNRSKLTVCVEAMTMLGGKSGGDGERTGQGAATGTARDDASGGDTQAAAPAFDDEVPF
jgi:single-strand DNA-binding protein